MSTLKSYITGYLLSVVLTLCAFGLLVWHISTGHVFPTHQMLTIGFVALAILQLFVQLFFFLHIGKEEKTHWNVAVLGFALFVVSILVGGTLWIMHNLEYHEVTGSPYIGNQITVQNEND
jgi:cytochrome o ubiquinol oxidase operon protein cyoD